MLLGDVKALKSEMEDVEGSRSFKMISGLWLEEAIKQKLISTEYYELHALIVWFQLVCARASYHFLTI